MTVSLLFASRAASVSLIALIMLCVFWEMWLSPLRPGGSWLVLKALPLLFAINGILNCNRYTQQWTSMLSLAYFGEGLVRATSDTGLSRWYAIAEIILALSLFIAVIASLRSKPPRA